MGSSTGGGGAISDSPLNCREVDEFVNLASPNPEAIKEIEARERLKVKVGGQSVVVVLDDDTVVGAISETWTAELRECIENQYSYVAEVISTDGAVCRVNVKNTSA